LIQQAAGAHARPLSPALPPRHGNTGEPAFARPVSPVDRQSGTIIAMLACTVCADCPAASPRHPMGDDPKAGRPPGGFQ